MSSFVTPVDALMHWKQVNPKGIYLRQAQGGQFIERSWEMVADEAARIAQGLRAQGLQAGDRVAILAKNSAEWFISDLAIMMAGCISVPIYFTANAETISYILEHSESKFLIVGKLDNIDDLERDVPSDLPRLAMPYPSLHSKHQWQQWLDTYPPLEEFHAFNDADIMTLIYTSGSTGAPKGAMISFGAYRYACQGLNDVLKPQANDRMMSYLPLAHVTERVFAEGTSIFSGMITISFVENLQTFPSDIQSVQPTLFLSVPRLWARFQQGVFQKIPPKKLHLLLKLPILGKLVKNKILFNLGLSQARLLGCGSAPVAPSLLLWFREKLGLNITQAWGMTENLAYGTLNAPYRADKYDTIGCAAPGLEMKITEQGELLVRSPAMMSGYWQHPELSEEMFVDGWMRTGDMCSIDRDGYVKIVGRVKESFKTSKGKYVIPVPIEQKLSENSMIEQVCVCGQGLPQPIALVVLAKELHNHSQEQVRASFARTLSALNPQLESHERISHVIVLDKPWSIENNLLTPTLKIRRGAIEQRFDALIQGDLVNQVEFERNDNWA